MVCNTAQHPLTLPATHCLYIPVLLLWYGGEGWSVGEVCEQVEEQQFTRGVENTYMTDCISSLYKLY